MKPWEETWELQHRVVACVDDGQSLFASGASNFEPKRLDREQEALRLAAAAPEMARLLLSLRRIGSPVGLDDDPERCAACEGKYEKATGETRCAPSCPLVAVLRKAGVLP